VLDGSNALLTCLGNHEFHACGYTGKLNYWGLNNPIGDWPLLQHVPDLAAIGLGADGHPARTRVLEVLSVVGIVGSLALARITLVRVGRAAWFWAFALLVLTSPFLWYARTTSGESFATGLLVCLIAATALPAHPALVGLAVIGACWTKETSYPFVAALGLTALVLARRRTGRPIRAHVIFGAAGMAVAITATSLFNEVRFGHVLNPNLFEAELHTPGIGRRLEYTAAVLVSPSGGVLFFWPAAFLLVLAACIVAWRRKDVDGRPALVIAAVVLALSFGFASWWTPFGWSAYGPRLALPWVLPIALLTLVAYGEPLREVVLRTLVPSWRLAVVAALLLVFTLPNIGQTWRPNQFGRFFAQEQTADCQPPWRGTFTQWNACQHRLMWLHRPMPIYAARGAGSPTGLITTVLVAAGLVGCLVLLRAGLSEGAPAARPAAARVAPARPR